MSRGPQSAVRPPGAGTALTAAPGWSTQRRGGGTTRKGPARIFGTVGTASENTTPDAAIEVYPGIPSLTQANTGQRGLKLDAMPRPRLL